VLRGMHLKCGCRFGLDTTAVDARRVRAVLLRVNGCQAICPNPKGHKDLDHHV
jgi:hypothetical protein